MSDTPIMTFQELETVLRIIDAAPRNGTVDISIGDLKLSVTRGEPGAERAADTASAAGPAAQEAAPSASAAAPSAPSAEPPAQAAEPSPVDESTASSARGTSETVATDVEGHVIESPMTGVFYRQPEPGAAAFVEEGARVEAGDVVAIIEVMKLMNRLTTPVAGTVKQVCADNEQLVEFGTPLFIIEPDASAS